MIKNKVRGGAQISGIICLFVVLFVAPASVSAATPTQSIIVPAYSYPSWFVTPFWQNIQDASSQTPFVIMNPASGPGVSANSDYTSQISRNTARSIRSLGYVDIGFQARPIADVTRDIDTWKTLYPQTSGYLIDQVDDATPQQVCYQATVYNYVKGKYPQDIVIANFGTDVDDTVEPYADIFGSQENTANYYLNTWNIPITGFLSLASNSNRNYNIIHTTSLSDYPAVLAKSRQANAGWVYITDDTLNPHPFDAPVSYWNTFTSDIGLLPRTLIPNRGLTNLPAGCVDMSILSTQTSVGTPGADQPRSTAVDLSISNKPSAMQSLVGGVRVKFDLPQQVSLSSDLAGFVCNGEVCRYEDAIAPGQTVVAKLNFSASCGYRGEPIVYQMTGSNGQVLGTGQVIITSPVCSVSVVTAGAAHAGLVNTGSSILAWLLSSISLIVLAAIVTFRRKRKKTKFQLWGSRSSF